MPTFSLISRNVQSFWRRTRPINPPSVLCSSAFTFACLTRAFFIPSSLARLPSCGKDCGCGEAKRGLEAYHRHSIRRNVRNGGRDGHAVLGGGGTRRSPQAPQSVRHDRQDV